MKSTLQISICSSEWTFVSEKTSMQNYRTLITGLSLIYYIDFRKYHFCDNLFSYEKNVSKKLYLMNVHNVSYSKTDDVLLCYLRLSSDKNLVAATETGIKMVIPNNDTLLPF